MSSLSGVTLKCAHCGRPIVGQFARFGGGGEPYHHECTLPPGSKGTELAALRRQLAEANERLAQYEGAEVVAYHGTEGVALIAIPDRKEK